MIREAVPEDALYYVTIDPLLSKASLQPILQSLLVQRLITN